MNEQRDPSVRLVGAYSVVLLGLIAWYAWSSVYSERPAARGGGDAIAIGSVSLEIDPGDGPPTVREVPWLPGMTVLDQLVSVAEAEVTDRGSSAFLRSISGRANEGAGGRNWKFWVNGTLGDAGAGAIELSPGDRVLWRLAPSE